MVLCGENVIFAHLDDQHLEGDAQGTVAHVSVEAVHLSAPERGHHQLRFQPAEAYNAGSTAPTDFLPDCLDRFAAHGAGSCRLPDRSATPTTASPVISAARTLRCVFLRPLTARSRFSVRSILRVLCTVPACTQPADKHRR